MNITKAVNKFGFALKKASPTIAVAAGIVGGVAAAVMACKATLKVDAVLDEARANVRKIHEVADNPELQGQYTESDKNHDLAICYVKTVKDLGKLYGPAIIVGTLSIASIIFSHRVMSKRVFALGASCTALGESLRRYRQNVAEKYGEEVEHDIYYGLRTEKIEETTVDEQTGKETKSKATVKVVDDSRFTSPFAVIFDKCNVNYVKDDPVQNTDFLTSIQGALNDKLYRQGWLFLNDARMALGYKPIPEGQVFGWIYDDKDPERQSRIDIGIDHISRQDVRDFRNGYDKVFVIDFNVDGPIIEQFHMFDRSNRVA